MSEWMKRMLVAVITKIVEQYVTEEILKDFESQAKAWAYEKLQELAKDTEWTEIDDKLVAVIGKAWGLA